MKQTVCPNFLVNKMVFFLVDVGRLETQLECQASPLPLATVCSRSEEGEIHIVVHNVPSNLKRYLLPLSTTESSVVFRMLWMEYGREALRKLEGDSGHNRQSLPIDQVIEAVCCPSLHQCRQIGESLRHGTMPVSEVQKYFSQFLNDTSSNALRKEIDVLSRQLNENEDSSTWIAERIEQMQVYHMLSHNVHVADCLMRLKTMLNLSGDFELLGRSGSKVCHYKRRIPDTCW